MLYMLYVGMTACLEQEQLFYASKKPIEKKNLTGLKCILLGLIA